MAKIMLKPVLKIGSIAAFVLAIVLYFWLSMRIPAPVEANRVSHRDGAYSIIRPDGWDVNWEYGSADAKYIDSVQLLFPTAQARDRRIFVGRLREKPDPASFGRSYKQIDSQFLGNPGWVLEGRTKLEHYWRALFEKDGQWYEIVFWSPIPEDLPNSGWYPYVQSFRASPVVTPTTVPATQP